ncbi:ImmA/IrrE family metallo-endopeptidase [Pseudarthrobacter oxydans]|uniref:ImmA/IrrE family metallo-endopeptidase n=1 Tax=Pseudarthrobacter oxydans TaxID=1671 RepID=UPI0037F2382B
MTNPMQYTAPTDFSADWQLSPGELLADELKHRGISQTDFAARTSLSTKHVNQIIKGHVPLSSDAAIAFERALNVPATLWLKAEVAWRAAETARTSRESFAQFSGWLSQFPLQVLRKRGIISLQEDVGTQVDKLLRWFEVSDPHAFDRVRLQPEASYKRSQAFNVHPYATATWLRLAEVEAENLSKSAPIFSAKLLKAAARQLPALTTMDTKPAFIRAQEILREAGVLLVFVEEIEGTRISGASKLLESGHHMIALTGRFNTLDSFWFALAHEIAHVLLHPKRSTYIDVDLSVNDDEDEQESEANAYAERLFLPLEAKERLKNANSGQSITQLAKELKVAPFMLAGQYGHMTGQWRIVGKMRKRGNIAELLHG